MLFELRGDVNQVLAPLLEEGKFILHQVQTGLTGIVLLNGHHIDLTKLIQSALQAAQGTLQLTDVAKLIWEGGHGQPRFNQFLPHAM